MKTKITYDLELDSKYIQVSDEKVSNTKEVNEWLIFDVSQNGDIVGIEVLNQSAHPVNVFIHDNKVLNISENKQGLRNNLQEAEVKNAQEVNNFSFA